jgi:SpoVK/Ycf46/Vps4 family AAA+-type ATPase
MPEDNKDPPPLAFFVGVALGLAYFGGPCTLSLTIPMCLQSIRDNRSQQRKLDRQVTEDLLSDSSWRLLPEEIDVVPVGLFERVDIVVDKWMSSVVGLEGVKQQVIQMLHRVTMNKLRASAGMQLKTPPFHVCLMGNPGTGKTSTAQLIASILFELGVVSKKTFKVVQRADLVGRYIGETAQMTRSQINAAKGGVLFVDEAYRLTSNPDSKDYGKEAVDEIMKDMLNGDPLVFVAGYTNEMEKFLQSNAGLLSRFEQGGMVITLPDYCHDDIARILIQMAKKRNFQFEENLDLAWITDMLQLHVSAEWMSSRNGRVAECILQGAIDHLNKRLLSNTEAPGSLKATQLTLLKREDVFQAVLSLKADPPGAWEHLLPQQLQQMMSLLKQFCTQFSLHRWLLLLLNLHQLLQLFFSLVARNTKR